MMRGATAGARRLRDDSAPVVPGAPRSPSPRGRARATGASRCARPEDGSSEDCGLARGSCGAAAPAERRPSRWLNPPECSPRCVAVDGRFARWLIAASTPAVFISPGTAAAQSRPPATPSGCESCRTASPSSAACRSSCGPERARPARCPLPHLPGPYAVAQRNVPVTRTCRSPGWGPALSLCIRTSTLPRRVTGSSVSVPAAKPSPTHSVS